MGGAVNLEEVAKFAQKCFATNPVVVVGSGVSAALNMPTMSALGEFLRSAVTPASDSDHEVWNAVLRLMNSGQHLEQALQSITPSESLIPEIVTQTWNCIGSADADLYKTLFSRAEPFPIANYFRKVFESSNQTLDVVTTNYDRIIEFACAHSSISYSTGFSPGYHSLMAVDDQVHVYRNNKRERCVHVWKVHGSLDWFEGATPICAPIFGTNITGKNPLIVTPGVQKYERALQEPFRSAIQGADRALTAAKGYICFGFGFRDVHVEPKIVSRCKQTSTPLVVATYELTSEAADFLKRKVGRNFLVLEKSGDGTVARTSENWDGAQLEGEYWSIDGFMKLVS